METVRYDLLGFPKRWMDANEDGYKVDLLGSADGVRSRELLQDAQAHE